MIVPVMILVLINSIAEILFALRKISNFQKLLSSVIVLVLMVVYLIVVVQYDLLLVIALSVFVFITNGIYYLVNRKKERL